MSYYYSFYKKGGIIMATKRTNLVPKAPVARILMNAGAKRVSADAIDAFAEIIEDIGKKISQRSAKIAQHSGRKTVQEGDVKLAAKE